MIIIREFLEGVGVFFIIYLIIYSTFLFLSVAVGASELYNRRKMKNFNVDIKHDYYQAISIIVPAYNEEITVVDTVRSLLSLNYRLYEIIIVDDGSKDDTSQVLIQYFNMKPINKPIRKQVKCQQEEFIYEAAHEKVNITLVRKKNGGKADALNMGINLSKYPYFVCMDSDSILQEDALEQIIKPTLLDQTVIACGGLVKIANSVKFVEGKIVEYKLPKKWLVFMQQMEYDRSFLAARMFWDRFNGNLIISGAFGLFKKDVVIAVGGYDVATMGEDMELVVKLHVFCKAHKIPYQIKYIPDAVCWSQAPESLKDLMKQRRRWHIGLFQTMMKYRQLFLNSKFGAISFVSYIYFLSYELFSPFIEVFGFIVIIISYILGMINLKFMLSFIITYIIFGVVLSMTAFLTRIYTENTKITLREFTKAILLCILENPGLRMIIATVRVIALVGYKKRKLEWGEIQRVKMNSDL